MQDKKEAEGAELNFMPTQEQILFAVLEMIALMVIIRIWLKGRHKRLVVRLIWSLILLVPFFGILVYFFLNENPKENLSPSDFDRDDA